MVTDLVGVDHIRPAFGFLTMIHGIGVSLGHLLVVCIIGPWWGSNVCCIRVCVTKL